MQALDMLGKPCPIPVVEAKKALHQMEAEETLEVLVDNEVATQNLRKMAEGLGYGYDSWQREDGNYAVSIQLQQQLKKSGQGEFVVAIGTSSMGSGDDELGAMLMKSYLYSLTELEPPPTQLLFFNGGVRLACAGSAALEDLNTLEAKGVRISACGACLNHYGLTEQQVVGQVTNMYAIAAAMAQAEKLVNL